LLLKRLALTLPLLTLLAGVIVLLSGVEITGAQPTSDQTKVRPEVVAALAQRPEVAVIISLKEKRAALAPLDVPALIQHAAAKQERVLAGLAPSDFTLTRQYQAVPALAGRITTRGAQKLAQDPDVVSIGIDGKVYASLGESVPLINADDARLLGITGEGIEVAVLDTGIDTDHSDLADDLLSENCFLSVTGPCHNGEATDSGPGSAEDDQGHGSRVSGIITSAGVVAPIGVAPDAGIRAYKVLNSWGEGYWSDLIAALDHIIVNYPGTDLVNMSLGDTLSHGDTCDTVLPTLTAAIDTLRAGGTTTVAASGNMGFKTAMAYPACISGVISVGMTYDETFDSVDWSIVPCTDSPATVDTVTCASNSSPFLDLLAPGSEISSSTIDGGTASGGGTSFAAPHVVGVAALLLEDDPTLVPYQLEYCLETTGVPITDAGNGLTTPRVDALAALSCTPPPPPTPTPTPTSTPTPTPTVTPPPALLPSYVLYKPSLRFGTSLAVGEVNGDGNEDIAVGAPSETVGGNPSQGRAYVFSGADTSLLFALDIPNPQEYAQFGNSVAVGDVNGDGKGDIAVGAPWEDVDGIGNQGRAYVFSGADGSLLLTLDMPDPKASSEFGRSMAVGDVNGDGKGDIAVGAPSEDVDGSSNQGRAYVFSGADGSLLLTPDMPDPKASSEFGHSVAVGDVNGDGNGDIAVGASEEDVDASMNQGRAYVFSGTDGSLVFGLDTPNPRVLAEFGYSVAVGDIDGNAKGDIAVGARWQSVGSSVGQGRAYVFSGTDGSLLLTLDTPNPHETTLFGQSAAVADVNGDGKGDIVIGAPWEDVGGYESQGRAYVFSGADGSPLFLLDTSDPQEYAELGYSVAVGDVSSDGEGDIAVGAPGKRSVYVFLSDSRPPSPTPSPTPSPVPVGGTAELPDVSASGPREHIALIALLAGMALVALTPGAWYAKRRWLR
jgi:subtilisin family serine protease